MTVAVPTATDVTKPLALTVAIDPSLGLTLHDTDVLPVLPSLKVAKADIWTVLLVVPVWIVGVTGPTEIEETVGFTKNPRQLAAKAKAASAAMEAVKRSFDFSEDILVAAPWRATSAYWSAVR